MSVSLASRLARFWCRLLGHRWVAVYGSPAERCQRCGLQRP
jgi:hypothetical protein